MLLRRRKEGLRKLSPQGNRKSLLITRYPNGNRVHHRSAPTLTVVARQETTQTPTGFTAHQRGG